MRFATRGAEPDPREGTSTVRHELLVESGSTEAEQAPSGMTALKEYARLESSGLWRSGPEVQRREVGLSFGAATLVISDMAGRPLTHWSLPAIHRLNGDNRPALYSPDPDGQETVEVEDDLMIDAIDTVRQAVHRARPRAGRLRQVMLWAGLAVSIALAVFWLPGALTRQTLSVVPQAQRAEIGATLLGHIQRESGASCRDPLGTSALVRLKTRVLGRDAPGQILVLPGPLAGAIYLPGGIILLSRDMVERPDDPAAVAGHVLAAAVNRSAVDPLEPMLTEAGLAATFRLLTTGSIQSDVFQAHATRLLRSAPPQYDPGEMEAAFDQARIAPGPWIAAIGAPPEFSGLATVTPAQMPEILNDGDWISLQNICRT